METHTTQDAPTASDQSDETPSRLARLASKPRARIASAVMVVAAAAIGLLLGDPIAAHATSASVNYSAFGTAVTSTISGGASAGKSLIVTAFPYAMGVVVFFALWRIGSKVIRKISGS